MAATWLALAGALRVAMLAFGLWQDEHMEVKYTDIDYDVFTDAAVLMAKGQSPFGRATYRYSPVLAALLLPNVWVHPCFGKVIFSTADLLVGYQIHSLLSCRADAASRRLATPCMLAWLFNPFTFSIATRGNCEALVCAMLLGVLHLLSLQRAEATGEHRGEDETRNKGHGVAGHSRNEGHRVAGHSRNEGSLPKPTSNEGRKELEAQGPGRPKRRATWGAVSHSGLVAGVAAEVTRARAEFAAVSAAVFVATSAACFWLYGWEYLGEALLYHVGRVDHRHNFSAYFYGIYLSDAHLDVSSSRFDPPFTRESESVSRLLGLLAFLPQLAVQLCLSVCFFRDLPFCMFAQTLAFVAFNKIHEAGGPGDTGAATGGSLHVWS